jgi:hypothetical protein
MDLRLCRCTVSGCKDLSDNNPLTGKEVQGQYISRREYGKHQEAQHEADPTAQVRRLASTTLLRTFYDRAMLSEIEG